MILPRKLFAKIEKYLESKPAIVVTGMRRVGKTTLLRYFFEKISSKNKFFFDLEDPLNQTIFSPKSYAQLIAELQLQGIDFSKKIYLFLDEIQYVPNLPSVVKYLYDHYNVKFFLTGSASFYLKNLFSESLAGRKYIFELFPLDFEEFIWFKGLKYKLPRFHDEVSESTYQLFMPLVREYLAWGGMPEVVLLKDRAEKKMAIRDIFASYFQKEVQLLGDFRKNEIVRSLIFLLGKRVGQKLDIQRLAQELNVARQTVYDYLGFLSGTYFISLIPAFGGQDVVQRKQRKVYFVDCSFFSIMESPSSGAIFENAVYLQLRDWREIYYYQRNQSEVDFVIKVDSKKSALEVKETATQSDAKKLKGMVKKMDIKSSFIVSLNYTKNVKVKYIFQLPKWRQKS